jgi:hypothetical protein
MGAFIALIASVVSQHLCGNGQPHWWPHVLSVPSVIFLAHNQRIKWISVLVIFVLALAYGSQYNRLVHSGEFIGTKRIDRVFVPDKIPVAAHDLWHSPITSLYALETKPKATVQPIAE